MDYFPRHYSIPRDGQVLSIVVNNPHDLRRLRTELEILRRARRQVVFRCTPFGQAPRGMFSDADHEELETILHDAEHPLVEEMIDHIDRAFPNTRKEIMMSVVNDEAQNIVQEAVEIGAFEDGDRSSTVANVASADAAIVMLAEAEAKLSELVEDSSPDVEFAAVLITSDAEASLDEEATVDNLAQDEIAESSVADDVQMQDEATTEDAKAFNDMEEAVDAIGEPPVSAPVFESPINDVPQASMQSEVAAHNTQPCNSASASESAMEVQFDTASVDEVIVVEAQDFAAADEFQYTTQTDNLASDVPQADENFVNADASATPTSGTVYSNYGPERAHQAVGEIETGIRKLANVLNTQVKDQWSQASEALGDIVEKRSQLEQKLFDATNMLEKLDRSRTEAAISRDAADVARREAELFRDDLRKLRDDAANGH